MLVSEAPPGTPPEAYRFPLRNRIIAALAEVVVVVESRERGGSLITAQPPAERGIPLMAVPGGVHNPAAAGTNELLREGAGTGARCHRRADGLVELDHRRSGPGRSPTRGPDPRDGRRSATVRACCRAAHHRRARRSPSAPSVVEVAMSLARLEQDGWVAQTDGWYQADRGAAAMNAVDVDGVSLRR